MEDEVKTAIIKALQLPLYSANVLASYGMDVMYMLPYAFDYSQVSGSDSAYDAMTNFCAEEGYDATIETMLTEHFIEICNAVRNQIHGDQSLHMFLGVNVDEVTPHSLGRWVVQFRPSEGQIHILQKYTPTYVVPWW